MGVRNLLVYCVSFGSALAIAISYTANHSIFWTIIHGILGWLYVIYYALIRSYSPLGRWLQPAGRRLQVR